MSVLVYQMGKVGASSVIWALKSVGITVGRAGSWNIHDIDKRQYEKIITMVRDPIHRNIAQLFTEWDKYFGYFPEQYDDEMMELFYLTFPHYWPLRWFENWMLPQFGIDVYREPFPKEIGWKIYDDRLLIIRTEDMSRVLEDALRAFLPIPADRVIDIQHRNPGEISRGTAHGKAYAEFKSKAKCIKPFLDYMYESKYVQHFYTEDEIADYRRIWTI